MAGKRIIIVYEPGQVADIARYLKETNEPTQIIALTFWVERELTKKGITFHSLSKYSPPNENTGALLKMAQDFAREWYRLPELSFFEYKGIRLGEALEPGVDNYLQRVFYYLNHIEKVLRANAPIKEIVICHAGESVSRTAGAFALFEVRAPVDVVKFLAPQFDAIVRVLKTPPTLKGSLLESQKSWYSGFLKALNWIVVHSTHSRSIKIFASEYWRHIAPFITRMDDVEMVLMDRSEIKHIPLRYIFSRRIRFMHPLDAISAGVRRMSSTYATEFKNRWGTIEHSLIELVKKTSPALNWWPLIAEGLTYAATVYVERIIADAEAIESILRREKINRVLLRGSHSGHQPHFFIAAHVASFLGIPSIELQHSIEVVDPQTIHSRLETTYLAAYGTGTRKIMVQNHHYASERIRPIGSPRFDNYMLRPALSPLVRNEQIGTLKLIPEHPVIFVAFPAEIPDLYYVCFSSYECIEFLRNLRKIKDAIPNVQFILKFRAGSLTSVYRQYIGEIFPDGGVYVAEYEDPFSLVLLSDIIFSGQSTLFYEGMIARKPVLLFPLKVDDASFRERHKKVSLLVPTPDTLIATVRSLIEDRSFREKIINCEQTFLKEEYSFNGKASERLVEFLQEPLFSASVGPIQTPGPETDYMTD